MANDNQFKIRTKYIGTRGVKEYRASIPIWVNKKDIVLEIGCEWGTTTKELAKHSKLVVGTDINPKVIEVAKNKYPKLMFEVLDVFDIQSAIKIHKKHKFNKMYIDVSGISGYRSLLDLIALLNMYASVFDLDTIVVKSGALKSFAYKCVPFQKS